MESINQNNLLMMALSIALINIQLIKVANRFFKEQNNLVILAIDYQKIASKIVTGNLEGGTELFPHIYDKLPLNVVLKVSEISSNVNGFFCSQKKLF